MNVLRQRGTVTKNLLFIVAIVLIITVAGGLLITSRLKEHAYNEIAEESEAALNTLLRYVADEILEADDIVKAVSLEEEIRLAVEESTEENIESAHAVLDRLKPMLDVSVLYLLNKEGVTIASTNRNEPDSFIGKNYQSRPYFQQALKGRLGQYFARGVTSGRRGYYASYPVNDTQMNIKGVLVVKKDIDILADNFRRFSLCFFVSPRGIIFLSSNPDYDLRSLRPLDNNVLQEILSSKQFGPGPFPPLFSTKLLNKKQIVFDQNRYVVFRQQINDQGWSVVLLASADRIVLYSLFGISGIVFLALLIFIFCGIIIYVDKSNENIRQSADRFRQISLNSQDWIWEMDAEGFYTYSNQAVQKILGYSPDEIVGKHFSDFLDPESKEQAQILLKTIFARKEAFRGFLSKNRHKKGHVIYCETSGLPSIGNKNNVLGYRGVDRNVTERLTREQQVKSAKEYAELLFEVTPSAVFTVGKDRVITSWNRKAELITGYSSEEIIGKTCSVFAQFPCNEKCGLYNKELEKPIISQECKIRTKSGEDRFVTKNADLLRNAAGEVIGGIESFEDITERKRAEAALVLAEEEWRRTFDAITDLVFIQDKDFTITHVNKALCAMLNMDPEEIIGQKCFHVLHKRSAPWMTCPFEKTRCDKKAHTEEVEDPHLGVPLLVTTSPIFSSQGEMLGSVHIAKDISASKQAQEELRQSEVRFRSAFENAAIGMALVSPDGRWLKVNDALCDIVGYSQQEMLSMNFKEITYPEDLDADRELVGKVLRGEIEFYHLEKRYIHKNGSVIWILLSGSLVSDNKDQPVYFVAQIQDITQRKTAENKLQEAMEIKSEFTSMVSHELRTPLTAIKESIGIVEEGLVGPLTGQQKDILSVSKRNVDRLGRLINDVLDFQKLEAGKMDIQISPQNINELLHEAYMTMDPVAKENGLDLQLEMDKSLPKCPCDRDRIMQVLTNLINNAIKFTAKGFVLLRSSQLEDGICVSVQDSGSGIEKNDIARVFQKFEQLEKGSGRKTGGSGLGLAISQEIIKNHNGKIWVESQVGEGSTFYITLPL